MKYHCLQNCYQKHPWNIQNVKTEVKSLKYTEIKIITSKLLTHGWSTNKIFAKYNKLITPSVLLPVPFALSPAPVTGCTGIKKTQTLINSQYMCVC